MFKLSINNYLPTKTIATEDGAKLTVRQLGAGEALEVSQLGREIGKTAKELDEFSHKVNTKVLTESSEEFEKIVEFTTKIEELTHKVEEIYLGAFEDGTENKAVARSIIRALGIAKMPALMKDIFADA